MNPGRTRPLADRFWEKVDVRGSDECWLWMGAHDPDGYGYIGRGHRVEGFVRTHRLALELAGRPVPTGLLALHHCDNPPCVNPAHLYVGTHSDNRRDAWRRGRRTLTQKRSVTGAFTA